MGGNNSNTDAFYGYHTIHVLNEGIQSRIVFNK